MNPITLMIIIVVPSATALVDCRTACRTCRENAENPSMMEVYCAMCEECKLRRREKLRLRMDDGKQNKSHDTTKESTHHKQKRTTKTHARDSTSTNKEHEVPSSAPPLQPDYHHNPHLQEIVSPLPYVQQPVPQPPYPGNPPAYLEGPGVVSAYPLGAYEPQQPPMYYPISYPNGCPTPPSCSGSEEEYSPLPLNMKTEKITLPTTTTTRSTTTATTSTTTTPQPCPRIAHCRRKRRKSTPEIRYIRLPQPPPPPPPPSPHVQYIPQPYPCMNPCLSPIPGAACPCPQYQPPPPIHLPQYQPFPPSNRLPPFNYPRTEQTSVRPLYLPDSTEAPYHPSLIESTTRELKSTTKNFFYVYVGVPKKIINS